MAKATSSAKSPQTTAVVSNPVIREMSSSFARSLADPNSSLIQRSLDRLRNHLGNPIDDDESIFNEFKYLKDRIHYERESDDGASLISLITVTLIIPCYHFYSTHDKFSLQFFQLFELILTHSSILNNENFLFSIAVFISRTNLYHSKSIIIPVDKWTIKMWLGKPIGQSSTPNKVRYQSEKSFPFAPDSDICKILCENTKYPVDITNQYDLFIERAKNHQNTNVDELTTLENILNQLCRCQFILRSFLNADQCLSWILSFAVQRQRIVDIRLTDESNTQAQTELTSVKNQMLNKFDYLPGSGDVEFKFIQNECRVRWTDGKEFIYPTNTIHPRPSFLLPVSKLLRYAFDRQENHDDIEVKKLWNLLLQTIYQTFTAYLENSASNGDIKDFFIFFLTDEDEQIRNTGAKLLTTFVNEIPIPTDENLPPLISCSILEKILQSMINNEKYSIKENSLDECLHPSSKWSIDDLCSLLTMLAVNLTQITDHWLQFFVNLMNFNQEQLISSIIKMNPNFIEFCRQIPTSLFIRLFQSTIQNSFQVLKFMVSNCKKDWIKVLLEIIDQQMKNNHVQENLHELLKDARLHAFDNWKVTSSFDFLLLLIKLTTYEHPLFLCELLFLLEKVFDGQLNPKKLNMSTAVQPIIDILHLVFSNEKSLWSSTFRRGILASATSILLHLIDQINTQTFNMNPDDMKRLIQSTILCSVNYKQTLRLFNFVLRSKQQILIKYWFEQLLTLALSTNETQSDDKQSSTFHLKPSTIMELIGMYTYEIIELLHEKFDHAMNLISLSTFTFLSTYIQQSLPICIQCLLHKNARIRVSIARLVGRALNMQSNDLIKLLQSLQDSTDEQISLTTDTSLNIVNDQQRTIAHMHTAPVYLLEREKKRSKSQIPFCTIKQLDFGLLSRHLEALTNFEEASNTNTTDFDAIRTLISECPEELRHLIPDRRQLPSLVQTSTMRNNRQRIIECIRTPIHLLLQGETGVGKSSLILDVAADLQKPLIRFNLSSKTDIGGLFGSVKLKTVKSGNGQQQEIELEYEEGPFTTAYRHGHWLLLDEMNLAPPNVLQAIEQALESGVLTIPNIEDENDVKDQQNQVKQNCRIYQIHPEFRLFATQNPSAGKYKDARDTQSTALLNRFSIFIVEGPKDDELIDIVTNKLRIGKFPFVTQAAQMVGLHLKIMNIIKENDFKERNRNYSEITIRELFRWCQSLCDYEKMLFKYSETVSKLPSNIFNEILTEQAYAIYGLRFREEQSREKIARAIENLFHMNPIPSSKLSIKYRSNNTGVEFLSQQRLLLQMPIVDLDRVLKDWPSHITKSNNNQEITKLIKIHNYFFKYFHNEHITQIYDCSYTLFWSMIERRYSQNLTLAEIIIETYTGLCRDEKQRMEITKYVAAEFSEPETYLSKSASSLSSAHSSFYLDNEANRITQFILAASPSQPILIVGPEGCGKSHLVQAIATLTNVRCQHLYLTPQTEPAALVGSLVPHPKFPRWHDGAVSEAITKGHWLILENFSEASSAVLERLNPVLEQPPQWVKVENNETEPVSVNPNFRIIATMSPPTGRLQNASIETNHELSPALYNRFLIIYYQGLKLSSLDVYKNMFTSYFPTNEKQLIHSVCEKLYSEKLTPRQLVQFIDCVFKLQHSKVVTERNIDLPSVLLSAYELVFKSDSTRSSTSSVKSYLEQEAKHGSINFFGFSVSEKVREEHREHIIDPEKTPTRYDAAKRLCASVVCSRPVLLEGPAATGKTSLIEYLAKCDNKILYRVNNTKGTTVQDYFGSYMPNGEFLNGALSRAMLDGNWFVADEFDLAEPAVMNVLYPILEGQQYLTVPNTGQTLMARDGFRFFATQNGTSYVGRKQLPKTLRSRFLEIQFHSFTEKELEFIIIQRKSTSTVSKPSATFDNDLKKVAPQIAAMVTNLNRQIDEKQQPLLGAPKLGLTMREVIKWINRKQRKTDVDWDEHALRLLESRVPKNLNNAFITCLQTSFPQLIDPPSHVKIEGNQISLNRPPRLPISYTFANFDAAINLQLSSAPQKLLLSLWRVFAAVEQHEPILLLGPTCYKTELIKIWSKLMAKESELCIITCSTSTETNDLIGSIRPYTHADALGLLLNCLNQLYERAKKNLSKNASAIDFNKFTEFRTNCDAFADDIDRFISEIKKQQEKKKVRKHQTTKTIEKPPESIVTSEDIKINLAETSQINDFTPLPTANLPPKSTTATDQFNSTKKHITDDDDDEYFEKVYHTKHVVDMMVNDEDDVDPFETIDNDQTNVDPFTIVNNHSEDEDIDPFDAPAAILTKPEEKKEEDEIDPFSMGQSSQLSDDEKIIEFFMGAQSDDQLTAHVLIPSLDTKTNPVAEAFQSIKNRLEIITSGLDDICRIGSNENGILLIKARCESIIIEIERAIEQGKSNIFLFQDGPVTSAIKEGKILILEDINEPSQAVIERLNSLFETEPSFILYEDFTAQESKTTKINPQRAKFPILPTFQVFATVHTDEKTENRLQLSAATRSRMTEIRVQSYDSNDLQHLAMKSTMNTIPDKRTETEMTEVVKTLAHNLAPQLAQAMKIDSLDSRHFVRFGECLRLHLKHMPIEQAAAICVKFLFLDSIIEPKKSTTSNMHSSNTIWEKVLTAFKCEKNFILTDDKDSSSTEEKDSITTNENLEKVGVYKDLSQWCTVEEMTIIDTETKELRTHWGLRLKSNNLIAPFAPQIQSRPENLLFPLALTKSVLNNISRIIFSLHSSNRQLLAGPPGVGKTKIIEVLAKMLGYEVVRINFSSNTAFEDLIGSFVPRVVNGQRSFEFQEGPLYTSLKTNRRNTVILFDELNLARKELLNQLMPLFANEKELFIPALAKSIPIDGSIIVAAMNPASIGGGREKLPRSTQAHFIQVQLSAFEVRELMYITISLLHPHLVAGYLTENLVEKINMFHYEISEKARLRQIGRLGGPYDFNLRDIEKLSKLIAAHSLTHRAHLTLSEGVLPTTTNTTDDDNLRKIEEQNIIRSLQVYLDIVYTSRFEYIQDQNLVREMIRQKFALNTSSTTTIVNDRQERVDSDLNLQGYARLGFVYIEKKEYQSVYRPLVHSQRTLEKLQLLAAATVSKATVLIEGGDCSGKTALVCELARICGRRLLVLNLNHETTTSDLLGSWTVINKHSYEKRRKQISEQLLNDIIRFALAVLIPLSQQFDKVEQLIRTITCLIHQWEHENSDQAQDAFQQCRSLLEHELKHSKELQGETIAEEIEKYLDILDQIEDEFKLVKNLGEGLTFTFNKGPLIQAMERGDWILFDNINCARGDVIERLNSLAEADPTLTLYESSEAQEYSRKNGIHKDFRLFVIANNNRKMANKLSSAWRNRCLIIRMQPLDDQLTFDNIHQHDLADIVKGELQGINGGQELAHTLLRTHASAKKLSNEKELQFITSYQLSYQNIKRSARILRTYISNKHDPVFALKPAIFRSYIDPILNMSGKASLIQVLAKHLLDPELNKASFTTLPMLTMEDQQQQMAWYAPAQNIHELIASIEECTIDLHLKIINNHMYEDICKKQEFIDYGINLLDYLQSLVKTKQENESDEGLYSQASRIRSKILIDDAQQSIVLSSDLRKWFSKTHQYLYSNKIILSFDNIDDSLNLLYITSQECYKRIIEFAQGTSFLDAQYRLTELQQVNNTINQLASLSRKIQLVCKMSHSLNSLKWCVQIQEYLSTLLITETYMKWVGFPCQLMAKNDLHIVTQTQESIRQRNQANVDDDKNESNSTLKLINVHLQKVQSVPIISSADQRLDIMSKLYQYLSVTEDDKYILLAASKLELNVACKLTMNFMIKSQFIEKMDEQQTLLNSSNLLASLNCLYFIHTILRDIYTELVSCHRQLDSISHQYDSEKEKLIDNVIDIDYEIERVYVQRARLFEPESSEEIINIDEELTILQDEENKLNNKKARHLNALKSIECIYENVYTLFLPLRESLKKFHANGWLQTIREYGRRRQENSITELLESISRIYIKEYDLSQTYSSSNKIDEENKQIKSDVLRQFVFNQINFDDINTSHGRASLTIMQLIYPNLFQQNMLIYILKEDTLTSIINKCLETETTIDILINVQLTNILLIDKHKYNRYSTNEIGIAHLEEQIILQHFAIDYGSDKTPLDDFFIQFADRFITEVKQRSSNTEIHTQRQIIQVEIDPTMFQFALPCLIQKIVQRGTMEDLIIEPDRVEQLERDIQNWTHEQRLAGTIRTEQVYDNQVENDIQKDITFFLHSIEQTEHIAKQTLISTDINIRELIRTVNKARTTLTQPILDKLEKKLDATLILCVPKEPIAKARTLAIVEGKQFRYPVLNLLKPHLSDSETKFHACISTFIDRIHMIQAKFLQILLIHRSNMNEIDLYKKSHQISKLLISTIEFVMNNIDAYGLKISVENFYENIQSFEEEILKQVAHIQFKTKEELTIDDINNFKLFTRIELENAIQHVTTESTKNNNTTTDPINVYRTETKLVKKNAEETMLERQNDELSKVEKELEQLRQLAKQNGLSRIQYAIVMLLMELNEIKRNKTVLNEVSLLKWRNYPKQLQRRIASESIEHKKTDIFNIKRVKYEKTFEITPEMLEKAIPYSSESGYRFSDEDRRNLLTLVKSLTDEKCSEKDFALDFLTEYFHQQTFESMWENVEKLIYEFCLPIEQNLSVQWIIDSLKNLMAIFIFLDSTSLAEICKELLQFCQEHAHDQTEGFHLPTTKLELLRTKTLENAIQQRSTQLQKLNPCDKSKLVLISSDNQDSQTYELIHIYPRLIRLYEQHKTLTRILYDQSNYNQSIGIQLSYLRLSDCIALLFPELPILFMNSLQLDKFDFQNVHHLDTYLSTNEFRISIEELYKKRFILENTTGESSISLFSSNIETASQTLVEYIRNVVQTMTTVANTEDLRRHWFYQLFESNEYHSFFAFEIQSFLSKLFDEMKDNLSLFKDKLDNSGTIMATSYLKFSDLIVLECGQELHRCRSRKVTAEKELNGLSSNSYRREELQTNVERATNECNKVERDYQIQLNSVANQQIRRLLEINRKLQIKGNYLPSEIIEKIENRIDEGIDTQERRQVYTSSEFYAYLFQSKTALLRLEKSQFEQVKSRVQLFIEQLQHELTQCYDDYEKALLWLQPDDNLYKIFHNYLLAYKLIHTQLLNSIQNWLDDANNQRNLYVQQMESMINQTNTFIFQSLDIIEPIINALHITSIPTNMEIVHQTVQELSQIAFHIHEFANTARVVYSSKVLSILLQYCTSLYARIAIFLVQLFKTQQTNPLIFGQLKTMQIKINDQSYEWDDHMKQLIILSGYREHSDLPGTTLPVDEYSLKEFHKSLSYDFPMLQHSLKLRYTHTFSEICYNPAAMINNIERKMRELLQTGDWNDGGRITEPTSKTYPLLQVSYNLNVLVNNTQCLILKILENPTDTLEHETVKNLQPFLTNLKRAIHLSCSSSLDTMHSEFLDYIHSDHLDLLLEQGLQFMKFLFDERKKLIEPLSHIRPVLENFVDQFILFFIQLIQQQQQKQIDFLEKEYNKTIKTRVNFEDIHLLETLSKANLIRLFRHIENIDEQIDWYNQLAQFLIQGWLQASKILRAFSAPSNGDHDSTSKRLRYSFVFKLLNDEGQQIFIFLKQTIGQLKEKYPKIEMLNDEPVIVYLIRLTKLLRYELLRMSTINLKELKIELNKTVRNTLRPNLLQIQSITNDWNKEINLLLLQRKKINESWVKKMMEYYLGRVRTIEEENKRSQQDYDLKCRQVQEKIERTKKLSIDILNDVKLIGQLLYESKFKTNNFDIDNAEAILSDAIQVVRRLLNIQQSIPKQCRLDDEREGKELMNMISVESIRIEVNKVEYENNTPPHKTGSWPDDWDNRIQLIQEGDDEKIIEGTAKSLDHKHLSKTVNNFFSYSMPVPLSKSWTLELYAGKGHKNKWTKMARIPLSFLDHSIYDEQRKTVTFGPYNASTITLLLTPNINIGIFDTSAEDAFKTTIESVTTTEGTETVTSGDLFLALRLQYQELTSYERKRNLEKWLMDVKTKCAEIQSIRSSDYDMPREPILKDIPRPETKDDAPAAAMRVDTQKLNASIPPTHHYLITQLPSKHEQLDIIITETIDTLNNSINDNDLDKIQHGIVRRFDSADDLKQGIKIFKDAFRFDKLLATLLNLHNLSIKIQKNLQSSQEFRQTLNRILDNLKRNGSLIQLSSNEGTISKETIDKLYTHQMNILLNDGNSLAQKELIFGIYIYRFLISTELNFIQLIMYSLETKEHSEQALNRIETIKQYWLEKDQQLFIDDKQIDACRRIIQDIINQIHERKKQIRSTLHQPPRIANLTEISKAVNVKSLLKSTGSPSTNKITINTQDGEYFLSQSTIIIQFEQIIQNWSYAQLKTKALELINNTDDEIDFEISSVSQERSLSVFTIKYLSSTIEPHDSSVLKIIPNSEVNEGKYREEWQLQLTNKRLSLILILCCEIKQFFLDIDLPLIETKNGDDQLSNQIKTYEINFGTVLACPRLQKSSRSFTIENPMSLDLRVKLRREKGATVKISNIESSA
ncbi:unnamed protein product [Adineta steineri]|uniref:Midasin n=1 Tax=Adineta steineri TaxID=433720 RepID=A0A813S605_9BILA|nr:unnamed protein product [Adineta steineri]